MRSAGFREREGAIYVWPDPSGFGAAQDFPRPFRNHFRFVEDVTEVQAKHATIFVNQAKRMKAGRLGHGLSILSLPAMPVADAAETPNIPNRPVCRNAR